MTTPFINGREPNPVMGEGAADGFTFRAPRWSDLDCCPVCAWTVDDPSFLRCDACGDEGHVFKEPTQ